MKTAVLFAVFVAVCAISLMALTKLRADEPAVVKADPAIVSKLEEIVKISERMVMLEERRFKAGGNADVYQSKIALSNARIELATELQQNDAVMIELEGIVTIQEAILQRAEARSADRTRPSDIAQIQMDLLHSQIRLMRAKSKD